MKDSYDLVIRGGTVVDGSGGDPVEADVAVQGARIAAVGSISGRGAREIDAHGKLVTPGFVDVHTHYDGQITWENTLTPSSGHGVTTVVMGNCGVGFAPIRKNQREMAVALMEGVEDIPGVVMTEGLPWNWETFPEYLDAIEARHADIDFAAQLPHSPLRVYVMGERGLAMEPPTDDDLSEMRRLTAEAIRVGALGVSTSRGINHRFLDGRPAPSLNSEESELLALAAGLRDAGAGVFQLVPNMLADSSTEIRIIERLQEVSGRPVSFTFVQNGWGGWEPYLEGVKRAAAKGLPLRAQFIPRPVGLLYGLALSTHPFANNPSYRAIADLPLQEKVEAMRDPQLRRRLIAEEPENPNPAVLIMAKSTNLFRMGNPPNYNPAPEDSICVRAAAMGISLRELLYDELLVDGGRGIIYAPQGNMDAMRAETGAALAREPNTLLGLGDGGAHYGSICDAGLPTYFLTKCVRDAAPDLRVPLPLGIKMLSDDCARAMGLRDRGLLKSGYKADINVIDFDRMQLHPPIMKHNLPAGGGRLTQKADGYVATVVSGQLTYQMGEATGALPGRLVRGHA